MWFQLFRHAREGRAPFANLRNEVLGRFISDDEITAIAVVPERPNRRLNILSLFTRTVVLSTGAIIGDARGRVIAFRLPSARAIHARIRTAF